jgi:uncharacterized membrane protein
VLGLALCAVGGCANLDETVPPVAALAIRGMDTAQLEDGRMIYLRKCTHCHVAEPVRKHATTAWPGILAEMAPKARLTPEKEKAVLAYVLAASVQRMR